MICIRSVCPQNFLEKSGILFDNNFIQADPGINIYNISKNRIYIKNFNSYVDTYVDSIIDCLKDFLKNKNSYIACIADNDAFKNLDLARLSYELAFLNLKHIHRLISHVSYSFMYDCYNEKLISEKISYDGLVANTYEWDGEILRRRINYYAVFQLGKNDHKYFLDYYNSFKHKLGLSFLGVQSIENFDYISDPMEIYIFSNTPPKLTKNINIITINMEQTTVTSNQIIINQAREEKITIADYSIENILYYNKNAIYLPYQYEKTEIDRLASLYKKNPKRWDVAFCGGMSKRRMAIINGLKYAQLSVLTIIGEFGEKRDNEISKCKLLINIHYNNDYKIYESQRCDRWAFAGMPVISENSLYTSDLDVYKYNLVQFYPYDKLIEATINFFKKEQPTPNNENIAKVADIRHQYFIEFTKKMEHFFAT
ncbi:MAG: hypothetical protein QXW79_01650 [Thermoplasmata archaeon]